MSRLRALRSVFCCGLSRFVEVGGEWFLMWQSQTWNGQEAAFRMFTVVGIVLILLVMKDEEL